MPARVRDLDVSIILMKMSDQSTFSAKWIRSNFGQDVYDAAARLEPYYWKDLRSPAPVHGKNYIRAR